MAANIPLPTEGLSGGRDSKTATATCYCGTVQILFPTEGPGFVDSFVCNCSDCHKITASMFASNFIVKDSETVHVRGQDKLSKFKQSKTIASGNSMENNFCSVCGTLMYRVSSGYPGMLITRIGTVDDFDLMESKLKPRLEQYTKSRVSWFKGAEGVAQFDDAGPLGQPLPKNKM
ncbi:glutathione-dependent formaldehyde-activating gfa protein [Rutstroemia sp. NJR-2017a BBW]|nr:glutathione-dependent formaldehyde-activating gfa protein [Rutstroemia sp. NJR-2017a BBW]